MSLGKANVTALNLGQGPITGVEKIGLFIGVCESGFDSLQSIGSSTDLEALFGAKTTGTLVKQLEAAQQNGGADFMAYAIGINAAAGWDAAVDLAFAGTKDAEFIVITDPVSSSAELEAFHLKATELINTKARRVFFVACVANIDSGLQTWSDYTTALDGYTSGVAANRVAVVPLLFGTDQGALAGRLASNKASIADSPMRVETGPVLGLESKPVDLNGVELDIAVLTSLDASRFTVVQWYEAMEGYYFGDNNLLEAAGGDYPVTEYLRPVDKAARRVRVLAIKRIADRKLNDTPQSIAKHLTYFAGPLREMAKSTTIGGVEYPGEIMPPLEDAVSIGWITNTKVTIGIKVKPYHSPKEIEVGIALDLS